MDTSQVTDMSQMFLDCHSLKKLDLSSFKTNQVQNMSHMFGGCRDLKSLNISNFDTSQVTDMTGMFAGCETLEELDLSSFDTTQVKDMSNMFESSNALKSIKLGKKFVVPNEQKKDLKLVNKTWVDIGKGTRDNPKPANKTGITSEDLLSEDNKGDWVVKPDREYKGPFTVQINNNLVDGLLINVPETVRPEYVGSTFEVEVPEKSGYKADKKTVRVMALDGKLSSTDFVTYQKVAQPKVETKMVESKPVEKPAAAKKPVATKPAMPVQSELKGDIEEFNKYVTIHPDAKSAQEFDSNGAPIEGHILSRNYTWFSDRKLTIDQQVYYHTPENAWVKANAAYECANKKNTVKTKDVYITNLVDSHAQQLTNRGLAALSTWKSQKVAVLNDHKYYQIGTNEFVDAEKVDLVEA